MVSENGLLASLLGAVPRGTQLWWPCTVVSVVAWVVHEFRTWYRLRHIPGPPLASISLLWLVRTTLGGKYHEDMKAVADKYGPLARIGPNLLISTDPEVLRMMSAVRSTYTKGEFYKSGRLDPGQDTIVSTRGEQEHKALRAKMGTAYGGKENEDFGFTAGVDRQVNDFVKLIDTHYISTPTDYRPVQFFLKASYFTLDVIGDIAFGKAFGFLAKDEDLFSYNKINAEAMPAVNVAAAVPWLTDILYKWPFSLALPKEGDKMGFGRLIGVAVSFVNERLTPGAKPKRDMMQAFINNGMTRSELIQNVILQIVAGSISSSAAISFTLLCLISNPVAYSKLQKEIDEAIKEGKVSSPITEAEARELPYLQAVIREGLRMYPPVIGLGSKKVPREGDVINGYFVPGGTDIGHNFFGVMRSGAVWGADPDVFRPERWLEFDEEKSKEMNAVLDLDFGYGKYSCLGKPIAFMELNKVYVELLRKFDFTIVNPQKPLKAESAVFWACEDFWLHVTRR